MPNRSSFFSLVILISTTVNMTVNAQVVSFEPNFATQYDSVTIYFDATQGNGALEGFSGRVFLHTGVITSESNSGSDWKYVPAGWESYPQILKRSRWAKIVGSSLTPQIFGLSLELQELLKKFLRLPCCLKVQGPYLELLL